MKRRIVAVAGTLGLAIAGLFLGFGLAQAIAEPRLNIMPDLQDEGSMVLTQVETLHPA